MTDRSAASRPRWARAASAALLAVVALASAGCTTVLTRSAVDESELDQAQPYGIDRPFIRIWGDHIDENIAELLVEVRRRIFAEQFADEISRGETIVANSLALSGGGPDGAYGAGLLAGWTERGDRPEFQVVTGVSTGAIIALFAFLGSDYDDELREIYTSYTTDDLIIRTIFSGLTGGTALLDTRRYRALIERYIDDDIVAQLAEANSEGRLLLVGTTNIDASRPVTWNLTAIAATGHPEAKRLIHDVIQASSAIPAAFPPVIIPVQTPSGERDEMHVDGGATQQVMLYSPAIRTGRIDEAAGASIQRVTYIVINNKLDKPYDPVRPRIFSIAGKAASSLIGGSGSGDLYRIFAVAQRDGIDLNIVGIPRDFDLEPEELFDPVYMGALYELGYKVGFEGEEWSPYPPDYAPPE